MIVTAQLTLSMLIGLCSLAARISAVKVPILRAPGAVKLGSLGGACQRDFLSWRLPVFQHVLSNFS